MSEQTSTPPAASASPVRLEKGASSSPASGAAEPVRLEKQTTTSTTAALPSRPTGAVPPSWQNPPPGQPQHKAGKGRQHGRHRVMAWTVAAAAGLVAAAAVVALTVGNPFQKTVVGIASPAEGAFEQESETGTAPELPSVGGSTDTEGTDSAPSTPATPDAANGDLGLSVPISSPACDSTWVVFLGAS